MPKYGKDQTYSREYNTRLVLERLQKEPCSGTELASELSLSNATVSSIIKSLEESGVICVREITSVNGLGRKRVMYELNPNYGLVLGVNVSNYHANISLIDMKQEVIANQDIQVEKYDASSIYRIVLESANLLISNNPNKVMLRCIVITLPGRVNSITGELALSKQFEKELFSEKHFIQNMFNKQFPNVPVLLANDNNAMAIGELNSGEFKEARNGIYFNIDFGIGGGIIINNKLYEGDLGYAGEFGLIKYYDGKSFTSIDEFVSLRALCEKASEIVNREVSREELIELYKSNKEVEALVIRSASIVGNAIAQLTDILDISKVILSGRVTLFGDNYLQEIKKSLSNLANKVEISYTRLGREAEIRGTSSLGVKYILDLVKSKK